MWGVHTYLHMHWSLTLVQGLNFSCKWDYKDLPSCGKRGTHHSSRATHLPDPHHTHPKYTKYTDLQSRLKILPSCNQCHNYCIFLFGFLFGFFCQSILAVGSDNIQNKLIISLWSWGNKTTRAIRKHFQLH